MRVKGSPRLYQLLTTIGNAAAAFSATPRSRGAYAAFREFDRLQDLTNQQIRETVRHAIGSKYVVLTGSGKNRRIMLTDKGRRAAGRLALEHLRPKPPGMWDGKWRVVLFDVPEEFKKNRNSFAAGLKRMGFVQIQKSCFALPYPCLDELDVLADFHEVREFVTFIVAESLEGSKKLEALYKLKRA